MLPLQSIEPRRQIVLAYQQRLQAQAVVVFKALNQNKGVTTGRYRTAKSKRPRGVIARYCKHEPIRMLLRGDDQRKPLNPAAVPPGANLKRTAPLVVDLQAKQGAGFIGPYPDPCEIRNSGRRRQFDGKRAFAAQRPEKSDSNCTQPRASSVPLLFPDDAAKPTRDPTVRPAVGSTS